MTKAQLRAEFRQRRRMLSDDEIRLGSTQIAERALEELTWANFRVVHTFLPIVQQCEVGTWPLIHRIWSSYPHILITIPRMDGAIPGLATDVLTPTTELVENRWGVPEAILNSEFRILNSELDLVIVPLLAYDARGYRVGYGKGYYDRFLAECRPDVLKIGVSFFEPVPRIDDVDEFDIRLDACVTPEKVISFR